MNLSKDQTNEDFLNISKMNNENLLMINSIKRKNENNIMIKKLENKNKKKYKSQKNFNIEKKIYYKSDMNISNIMNNKSQIENGLPKKKVISEIKINRTCLYICFFYVRRRKNIQNILLNI